MKTGLATARTTAPTTPPTIDLHAWQSEFEAQRLERQAVTDSLKAQLGQVAEISNVVVDSFRAGGKLITGGNGGSGSEADHFVGEIIGHYKDDLRRPLPAFLLNGNLAAMTCISNDYGPDHVFARQVQALAQPDDVVFMFSTSGKSANVVSALEAAKEQGATTVALLGKGGGPALPLADYPIVIDSDNTARIQEAHQFIMHLVSDVVDKEFGDKGKE